jgi:hypothetical protein
VFVKEIRSREVSLMAGSGGEPKPNRLVTFLEVNFSSNLLPDAYPDPYTGFVTWKFPEHESGSISITRWDGAVLSFDVTNNSFAVQTRENVIRWSAYGDDFPGSDGPFQFVNK